MAALAIHGGAGLIRRVALTPDREAACRAGLSHALEAGMAILERGGSALDACVAAVQVLEDDPLFNAGRGAVLAADGTHVFDASVMCGHDHTAGAIAGVRHLRNPILGARAVLDHSPHVLLVGREARAFCEVHGCTTASGTYFLDAGRWRQLLRAQASDRIVLDHDLDDGAVGTVGAVACDDAGHVAAATSTGGMANKHPARVGDTGLIGAGTWADDATCAVSATGEGEAFIRLAAAARTAHRMELAGASIDQAAHAVVHHDLARRGAKGGLIAVDQHGNLTMPFNTAGMYRGWWTTGHEPTVAIWGPEENPSA